MSDSSDVAPSDFPLSSSDDDLLDKTETITDKCPLCRSSKKHFYCCHCIRNGDFYSSLCVQRESSQRFVEKKLALLRVKGEVQELVSFSQTCLAKRTKCETMRKDIRELKQRIQMLKTWRDQTKQSLLSNQPVLNNLRKEKQEGRSNLNQLVAARDKAEMQCSESTEKNETISTKLELHTLQLKQIIRENVIQLVHSIFPITCEGQTCEEDSESLLKVKDALADASQTAYVRGQWVYSDTGHGGRYRIAGAYLPGTGDMAAYQLCVNQANKDGDIETLRHFKVALSHVTQLSHLLAFYFGLRLPKKVNQMDFMRSDLDPKRFAGRLARLHMNILYICTSQGVAPVHLRNANPLARLLTLLETNICDLGRYGPIEYSPELWFEEATEEEGGGPLTASPSTTDDEEDSDPLNADWESVANPPSLGNDTALRNPSNLSSSPANSSGGSVESNTNNVSVVGGVVSGVASLWKAWPWSK